MQHGFNLTPWPLGIDPVSQFLKWQTFKRINWRISKYLSNEESRRYVMVCNGVSFFNANLFYLVSKGFLYLRDMPHEEFTIGGN